MESGNFNPAHLVNNRRVGHHFGQLCLKLINITRHFPYNRALPRATHLYISIDRQVATVSTVYVKWEGFIKLTEWLVKMSEP